MAERKSDRYVTPPVVIAAMILGTLVVLSVVASVTYLTAHGLDPDPMLRLAANVTAAVGSLGTLLLQLTNRRTTTNVERKTGQLEAAVVETLEVLEVERGRHAAATLPPVPSSGAGRPPVPDATRVHPFAGQNAAPTPGGR